MTIRKTKQWRETKKRKATKNSWNWNKDQIPKKGDFFVIKWIEGEVIRTTSSWTAVVNIGDQKWEHILFGNLWKQIDKRKKYYGKKEKNEGKKSVGKPLKYSVEELQEKFEAYKKYCSETVIGQSYVWKNIYKPLTISGFNIFIWVNKDYLRDLSDNEAYSGTIAYIRHTVESDVEERTLVDFIPQAL